MAVTYICDVCKKKTKEAITLMAGFWGKSPFKHLCQPCWDSVIKFLKERVRNLRKKDHPA